MDVLFDLLTKGITEGGIHVVVFGMALIIFWLLKDRIRLIKDIETKEERINTLVDDYKESNDNIVLALDGVKTVLYEIKGMIK